MPGASQNEWDEPELENLANLAENLVYRLPGCDEVLIRKTLQEVAREFVAETQCLTSRQLLEADKDGMCYPVPFFGGAVADVREVWLSRRRLAKGRDWEFSASSGLRLFPHLSIFRPDAFLDREERDARRFTPGVNMMESSGGRIPDGGTPVTVFVVERLPLFSEMLPRAFLQKHGDALCSGTLGRLFAMSGKPWSDPQQALDERIRYDNAKSEERMKRETPPDARPVDTSDLL